MDFQDTPEEAEFRAEANAFLSKHLQPKDGNAIRERGDDFLKRAKEWQKTKAEGGFRPNYLAQRNWWPRRHPDATGDLESGRIQF